MNSIVSEKRIHFVGLPILVIALCLFYMLGAAALVAEAVRSGELAEARGARALVVPAALGDES
ncbi:MAG TPA: hypothetical protein VEJ89_11755 [Myxococcaceae bacterium]|jgi:hypothetical protein|nr:hypothetical protein [Myxococcaceae bacterium]